MRVAVTGADGFTGRYVMAALADADIDAVSLAADLTDAAATEREVVDTPFDRLIHLAGLAFTQADDPIGFYAVNQLGTMALLDAVARHRPGARCILASSAQVYGARASGLIGEDHPVRPGNHYAMSKFAMENCASLWSDRLEIVVTRPFNYTGIGQEERYVVSKIVSHFQRRATAIELGNIFPKRDFGDVRAVAQAYLGLIRADAVPKSPINLCTGQIHSIADIIDSLQRMTGHDIAVTVNPAFVRADEIEELGGDPSLLRTILPGWRPGSLEQLLGWMLRD